MRGILALSALHLARYRPEKKDFYTAQAMQHHQIGLRQATTVLTSLNQENCTGVYIFSALTLFFSVATPRKPSDFLLISENGIADWLALVKGTNFIIVTMKETLMSSSLGPMFTAGKRRIRLREAYVAEASPDENPLAELTSLVLRSIIDGQDIEVYLQAIELLRQPLIAFTTQDKSSPYFEAADAFVWVFLLSDRYLELLRQRTQESLCIFAYFCVVLRRVDSCWWLEGWAMHLIAKIHRLLDEEHRLWIRWAVEEIGWIPT